MAHAEAIDGGFAIDPDDLARLELSMVRRGYDPGEVQAVLASTADTVRALQEENAALRRRIEETEAAQALEEARQEGKDIVEEARMVRRRVLEDLARRRATMGRQIEQLRAGRDRLVEAFELIRHTVDEATHELAAAMPQAQAAAARAGGTAPAVMSVEDLEEELQMARVAELPIMQQDAVEDEDEDADEDADEPVEVADEILDDDSDVEGLFDRLRAEATEPAPAKPTAAKAAPREPVDDQPSGEATPAETEGETHEEPAEVDDPDEADDEHVADDPLDVVEGALARRLKRALADDQNAALERVGSRQARTTLDPDRILGGTASERLQRYEMVAAPHLDEAAAIAGGSDIGDLAAQLADRIVTAIHADVTAAVDQAEDDDDLAHLLRASFRRVKTQDVSELAAEFVQSAGAPDGSV